MKHTTTLAPLHISNTVFFKGTLEEIQAAERKEASRADEIERIITAPDFIALEYISYNGQRRILHKSTRPGVKYQLSYIDPDGVPAMHENFISLGGDPYEVGHIGSERELYRHFIHASNSEPLKITILTR